MLSTHQFIIFDVSDYKKPEPLEQKIWEIWLGDYHLGQGHHPPHEPEKVGEVKASSFKIACYLYELESNAKSLRDRMERRDTYIEDIHFGHLYYKPETNSNSWTGKYYESYEEALKSFH